MPADDPTPLRLPSLDALLAFAATARHASVERAAEALNLSPSAVSKRLAGLEELLGCSLLMRSSKPLALSAAGKEYLAQIEGVLDALAAIPQHRRAGDRPRRLRVSVPPTFGRQVLVPALQDFAAAHPQVELELTLSVPLLAEGDDEL